MTVENIIKAVRFCYDEEALNAANFGDASSNDNTLMDNIIKSKIIDALRWVCLYAPAELLCGTDSTSGTDLQIVFQNTSSSYPADTITDASAGIVNGAPSTVTNNRFQLPTNFIRLIRVRGNTWHRAVSGDSLIQEDSDEYLQLHDPTCAYATADRPQVAIINKKRKELECWPAAGTYEYTCIVNPSNAGDTSVTTTGVQVPPLVQTSFIYYLAFLVLSAYEDSRAVRMLEIAKMNLSRTENTQNK